MQGPERVCNRALGYITLKVSKGGIRYKSKWHNIAKFLHICSPKALNAQELGCCSGCCSHEQLQYTLGLRFRGVWGLGIRVQRFRV